MKLNCSCKAFRLRFTLATAAVLSALCPAMPSHADVASTIVGYGPLAFYQLNETGNPASYPLAVDSMGGTNNGTYLPGAQNAYNGISGPPFAGFPANGGALKTTYNLANAFVGLPGINLVGTSATILAWIKPTGVHSEQAAGVVFNTGAATGSGGTNSCGLGFCNSGTRVGGEYPMTAAWQNNGYNWSSSGVYAPSNQWSMAAMVVTSTGVALYCFNTNNIQYGLHSGATTISTWLLRGTNYIGTDPYGASGSGGPGRNFDGLIADVAIFNYSLSSNQLNTIFSAAFASPTGAPSITAQPSPASVYPTSNATFTVVASGTQPLAYQWRRAGTNLLDQGNISGSTNATLTLTAVAVADAFTNYDVVVTNSFGAVTSTAVALTVMSGVPSLTGPSPASVYQGSTATFTVVASGPQPMTYRWQRGGTNLVDQANVSGSAGPTLTLTSVGFADATNYSVVVTNAFGAATSTTAALTVLSGVPSITGQPSPASVYQGSTATFTVVVSGPLPLTYRWQRGGTNLVDQGNISGSATSTLTLANVAFTDAASYDVVVTNLYGAATSAVVSLTVGTPSGPVANRIVALGAIALWELNETNDPALGGVVARDSIGSYNGTYAVNAQNGNANYNIDGPQPPDFPGFTSTNKGLKTTYNVANSYVALPAVNYVGNTATMLAWVNPNSFHGEAGILFNTRDAVGPTGGGGTNSCGLGFCGSGANAQGQYPLMALWKNNGWNWGAASGVYVPTNQWSLVAGVATPTNITVFMFNTNGMASGSTNYNNGICSWSVYGTNWIGIDPYDGAAGSFDGRIDDVAFFGHCLSVDQLQQIYLAGVSNVPAAPDITSQPSSLTVGQNSNATFTVVASGASPLAYQWRRNTTNLVDQGNISGSTNTILTLTSVSPADAANYDVVITNNYGAVTSDVAVLTVLAGSPPSITSDPIAATVYQGSNAAFTVTASGSAPLVYRWQRSGTNLVDRGNISGSAASTLTVSNVTYRDGSTYSVVVTNDYGSFTSKVVALTVVLTNLVQVSSQPVSVTLSPGQTAHFTISATTGGTLYYQWFTALPSNTNFVALVDGGNISGSATANLTVSGAGAADWGSYYVQVSNADGSVVSSSIVTLSLTSWEQFGQGGVVNAVATSPDGAWIASGSDDSSVKLWHASDYSLARTLTMNGLYRVTALQFSPDSTILAAGYVDGSIRLWNPSSGALSRTINLSWSGKTNNLGKITSLSFSPNGQYLAAGSGDSYLRIWKVSDGTSYTTWINSGSSAGVTNGPVESVAFSPDGTKVAVGTSGRRTYVLTTNTPTMGNVSGTPVFLGSNVTSVAFSPDGTVLAAGCLDGTLTFWLTTSFSSPIFTVANPNLCTVTNYDIVNIGNNLYFVGTNNYYTTNVTTVSRGVTSLAFGTDGQTLFSGDEGGFITRWTASGSSWNYNASWVAHSSGLGSVRSLAVTPDNSKLVSGGGDSQASVWQASTGAALTNLTSYVGMITRISFSPDGSMVAAAANDGSMHLWAADSGVPLSILTPHTNQVSAMAFSPDSALLVSGGGCADNTIRIYSSANLASLRTIATTNVNGLNGLTNGVAALAVSRDSSLVAAAGDRTEQLIRIWRTDGSWRGDLASTNGSGVLAFSPDGQYLASGGLHDSGTITLWKVSDGSWFQTLTPPTITDQFPTLGGYGTYTVVHTCSILSLAFNPTTTLLASAGEKDGVVHVWQIGGSATTPWQTLTALPRGARLVAFSPDGTLLAAAGSDAIQMWRTSDWQPVWNYTAETVGISSLSFSPNGTYLVFGRDDGTVARIWNPLANPINLTLGVPQRGRLNIANPYSPFLSVWASSDLSNPLSWSLLTNVVASTNLIQMTDPSPGLPRARFYQVTTPP